MGLLDDLVAFFQEHRGCGEMDSDVSDLTSTVALVTVWCSCGARIRRCDETREQCAHS